ncbi:hypothetical protein ACFO0N_08365 [Halobium salinum]|uniref:Uncharacterized protein n=1 Tax=Halobium salinum TaxID=1364940 RepID=A0ABD5PB57_9EURY|nr:hypothetical protein [Halobium salinum]
MTETAASSRRFPVVETVSDYVNHENVAVRFVSLWTVLMALFVATWYASYYFLPEGLLRSTNTATLLPEYAGSVWREFLAIIAINLVTCLIVAAANTFRSVRTPMGYVVVTVIWLQGAVVWGTNSLAIEAGRLAPSLSVLLGRSGLFELTAYVAVAVATRELYLWHQRSGPRWREEFERVRSPRDWRLSRNEWLVLLGGLLLLAAANYREAVMISQVVG